MNTHTHTHKQSTVTLVVHACRGLTSKNPLVKGRLSWSQSYMIIPAVSAASIVLVIIKKIRRRFHGEKRHSLTSAEFFRSLQRDVTREEVHEILLRVCIKYTVLFARLYIFKRMVKRCIAAGCSNTYKQNVSLFIFPRDPTLRERWTRQVRRTRAGWSGPTATSYLCSNHFTED